MAQVNKFITSRTSIDNPFPKYRSVKYRVDHSLLPKSTFINNHSDIVGLAYKPGQPSWKKPSSYSQHRRVNSSAASSLMPQESNQDLKMSYLGTWDKLLSTQERSQVIERQGVEVLRVHLPSITNFQPSKFTALDPLFLPIEDIERGIQELTAALPPDQLEMAKIHLEMSDFQARINAELDECQRKGVNELKRLRDMLRSDRVEHHAQNMRLKRQAASITLEYQQFTSNFEQTKAKLDPIQTDIFSTRPFDLIHSPEYDEQFPQAYF